MAVGQAVCWTHEEFWIVLSDLHRLHYHSLVRLAALFLDDAGEDAVQDAFVKVSLQWNRIRDADKVLVYVRRAVVNNAKSELRHRMTARRHPPAPPSTAPPSEDVALRHLADEAVVGCLRRLPPRQAACVGLRFYLDLSEKETAEVLRISAGSVKQHTSRAMRKLAPVFEAHAWLTRAYATRKRISAGHSTATRTASSRRRTSGRGSRVATPPSPPARGPAGAWCRWPSWPSSPPRCSWLPPSWSGRSRWSPATRWPSSSPASGPSTPAWCRWSRIPAGSTMAAIQARGVLRVGIKFDQPYFGDEDPATHDVAGFDAEIAKLIAVRIFGGTVGDLGDRVEWVQAVSGKRESLLEDGTVDIVVATYSITDERRQRVDFAGPYYQSSQDIMVRADDGTIRGVDDLGGRRVCTAQGSTSYRNLVDRRPDAVAVLRDTYSECADALRTGVVDAVTTDRAILSGYNLQSGGAFKLLNASFGRDEHYGIGLRKDDPGFRSFLNQRLRDVVANGDWNRAARYSLSNLEPLPPEIDDP